MLITMACLIALATLWLAYRTPGSFDAGDDALSAVRERLAVAALPGALGFSATALTLLVLWPPWATDDLSAQRIGTLRAIDARFPDLLVDLAEETPSWSWVVVVVSTIAFVLWTARRMRADALGRLVDAPLRRRPLLKLACCPHWLSAACALLAVASALTTFSGDLATRAGLTRAELRSAELHFERSTAVLLDGLAAGVVGQSIAVLRASSHPDAANWRVTDEALRVLSGGLGVFERHAPDDEPSRLAVVTALERATEFEDRAGGPQRSAFTDHLRAARVATSASSDTLSMGMTLRDRLTPAIVARVHQDGFADVHRKDRQRLTTRLTVNIEARIDAALAAEPAMVLFADALLPLLTGAVKPYATPAALEAALERMWSDAAAGVAVDDAVTKEIGRTLGLIDMQALWSLWGQKDVASAKRWIVSLHESAQLLDALPLPAIVGRRSIFRLLRPGCTEEGAAERCMTSLPWTREAMDRLIYVMAHLAHDADSLREARDDLAQSIAARDAAFDTALLKAARAVRTQKALAAATYKREPVLGRGYCCDTPEARGSPRGLLFPGSILSLARSNLVARRLCYPVGYLLPRGQEAEFRCKASQTYSESDLTTRPLQYDRAAVESLRLKPQPQHP